MKFIYRKKNFDIKGVSENDHIYKMINRNVCFYEIDLLEYMYMVRKYFVRRNSVAIDVGANIGNHSIFFSNFLTDNVISVDPNPSVIEVLRRNLEKNANNFTIETVALGEASGSGRIVQPQHSTKNIGEAKVLSDEDGAIKIVTLDQMTDQQLGRGEKKGNVSLIKIDVEGMELAVLKGSSNILETHKPQLFVEAQTESEFRKLENYLSEFGYKSLGHWASTPVYHFVYMPAFMMRLRVVYARFFCRSKMLVRSLYLKTKLRLKAT
jgi:FkbM family methyltransferase